jgi:hypothetical protein
MNKQVLPKNMEPSFLDTAARTVIDKMEGEIYYLSFINNSIDASPDELGAMQTLTLEPQRQRFLLENYTITADLKVSQLEMLKKLHGIDTRADTLLALSEEDKKAAEHALHEVYFELGKTHAEEIITPWQKSVQKIFKKITFPDYAETPHDFAKKIMLYSNMIMKKTRKGRGDFVVVSPLLASFLQEDSWFTFSQNSVVRSGLIYQLGEFPSVAIYVDPLMKNDNYQFLVGRKTKMSEVGVYFIEGESSTAEISNFGIEPSIKLIVRNARCIVSTTEAKNNYISKQLIIGKKPWWRKIFKL